MKKQIFVMTIFVFALFSLLFSCGGGGGGENAGSNAGIYLLPAVQSVNVGDTFSIDVTLDTNNQPVTAVSAYIIFPLDLLMVESIDVTDSDFGVEAENTVQDNVINITRGQQTPGVNDPSSLIATIDFTPLSQGTAKVLVQLISPGAGPSRAIKDNGLGTDILTTVAEGIYTIQP